MCIFNWWTDDPEFWIHNHLAQRDDGTVRKFYDSLRPGGTLMMSVTSKEIIAGKFQHRTWDKRAGMYSLKEHEIQDSWSWMGNRWIIVSDGGLREFTLSHRLHSPFELTELLEWVGFNETTVYSNLDGKDYNENADRLVVITRK